MSEQTVGAQPNWVAPNQQTNNLSPSKSSIDELVEQPSHQDDAKLQTKIQHSETASPTRKQPKRKQSVFSFNGFPDASLLLDQHQSLKSRHTPADQDQSTSTKSVASTKECALSPATGATGTQSTRVPQVRAMDNLGSTGSSRASSCDEPSLATSSDNQQHKGTARNNSSPAKPVDSTPLHMDSVLQEPPSSGSSLDSVNWCFEQINHPVAVKTALTEGEEFESTTTCNQQEVTVAQNNANQQQHKQSPRPPPFESIASQLKQLNVAPDAQLIQRHIDNLISHNEAIIDNCNLISIRSYNSSQQQAAKRLLVSASTTDKSPSDTIASVTPVPPKLVQQARSSKRWSTSGVPSSRAGLCSLEVERHPIDTVHNLAQETTARAHHLDNHILKHLTQRKRSYNLPIPPPIPTIAFLEPLGPNLLPDVDISLSSLYSSKQLPQNSSSSPRGNSPHSSALDSNSTSDVMLGLNETKQHQPQQLEDAIQNLSLKRREEVLQQQQKQGSSNQFDQLPPIKCSDTTLDCNINSNKPPLHNHHHHHHYHHHRSYSITGQNLISAATSQQDSSQDQQIMTAAMLLNERFRQSIMEQQISLENQALFHHQQQQMIEQQLEQFRFAAALEHHQLQLSSNNKATFFCKEEQSQLGLLFQACNQTDPSILKRQLMLVPQTAMNAASEVMVSKDNSECSRPRESLPFKKRKISEPNMRH